LGFGTFLKSEVAMKTLEEMESLKNDLIKQMQDVVLALSSPDDDTNICKLAKLHTAIAALEAVKEQVRKRNPTYQMFFMGVS
jgi:hypothetical protein